MATESTAPASVFITGATSALGLVVARQFAAAGHKVTGTAEGSDDARLLRAAGGLPAYPSLTRAGELRSIIQAAKATVVVNLAPQIANQVPFGRGTWNKALLVDGTQAIIEAAKAAGVGYLLHTSYAFLDAAGHGETPEVLSPLLLAASSAERYVVASGIPAGVLRLGYWYGGGASALDELRASLRAGRVMGIDATKTHANFIHAADAASAIVRAVEQQYTGDTLNIVDDHAIAPAAFLRHFAESQGLAAAGLPGFAARLLGDKTQAALLDLNSHADNAAAKAALGWQPRFATIQQGIDDTLLTWRANEPIRM
jgi:nucleoside-diphosphate-sugar epimerase